MKIKTDEARPLEGLVHVALTQINLCLECPVTRLFSFQWILLGFTFSKSEICRHSQIIYHQFEETKSIGLDKSGYQVNIFLIPP